MKVEKIGRLLIATIVLAALLMVLQCATEVRTPDTLGLLNGIRTDRLILPAPPDTLVLVTPCPPNVKMALPKAETYDIPVPPDRKFGKDTVLFFGSTGDRVIEVLKSEVTPEGYVKMFKRMNTGEEYYVIRVRKAPKK
jgi:hypothetical protein